MNAKQIDAIRCAQADLIGAYQAYKQMDIHAHDWKAHLLTIDELTEAFADILEPYNEEDEV
jgi:hypothetical protein